MDENALGCGCFVVCAVINLTLGTWATSYLLMTWFAKDIPWYGDMLIGLIGGELIIPGAIVTWLLKAFGVL